MEDQQNQFINVDVPSGTFSQNWASDAGFLKYFWVFQNALTVTVLVGFVTALGLRTTDEELQVTLMET